MNLNKYEAVNEHRKMWSWILEETKRRFSQGRYYGFHVNQLKKIYLEQTYPYDKVYNSCFLCDYVLNNSDNGYLDCSDKCPLFWGNSPKTGGNRCIDNRKSPYYNLLSVDGNLLTDPYLRYKVLKWIEEMINLPVREDA